MGRPATPDAAKNRAFPGMNCPHCGCPGAGRNSFAMTDTYREIIYQCRNPECSFSWVAGLEAIRALSPSGTPNPAVKIPSGHAYITRRKFNADPAR